MRGHGAVYACVPGGASLLDLLSLAKFLVKIINLENLTNVLILFTIVGGGG